MNYPDYPKENKPCSLNSSPSTCLDLLESQNGLLADLEERLEVLAKRLSPLRNTRPCDPSENDALCEPCTSLVCNQIRNNNCRIVQSTGHIMMLLNEIEL